MLHKVSHICDKKRDPAGPARTTIYELRDAGRIQIYYMGKNAYLTESWEEIVLRIDAEDRAAGKKMGGPSPKALQLAKRQREAAKAQPQEQPHA
jgi:hypothetical protein